MTSLSPQVNIAEPASEFHRAFEAMDSSFQVRLIGTFGSDLVYAPASANASEWLANNHPDFDQFPVRNELETVGILVRRADHGRKTVGEAMLPLRENLIVSAEMPIAALIPELRENHFRLILRGGRLDGLVTQSDLLKLPVRLVLFGLITHLEQAMARVIARRWPNDSWLPELRPERRRKVEEKQRRLQRRRLNPALLELTEFVDKGFLCIALLDGERGHRRRTLEELRELRNHIAHAADFLDVTGGRESVIAFVDRFENAEQWIRDVTELLTDIEATT